MGGFAAVRRGEPIDADDDGIPDSTCFCHRYAASWISRCWKPRSIARVAPPIASILAMYSAAPASIASVSDSTKYDPRERVDGVRDAGLVAR